MHSCNDIIELVAVITVSLQVTVALFAPLVSTYGFKVVKKVRGNHSLSSVLPERQHRGTEL